MPNFSSVRYCSDVFVQVTDLKQHVIGRHGALAGVEHQAFSQQREKSKTRQNLRFPPERDISRSKVRNFSLGCSQVTRTETFNWRTEVYSSTEWQVRNLQLLTQQQRVKFLNGVNQLSSSWLWLAGNEKEYPCCQSGSILPRQVFFAFISDRRSTSISGAELSRGAESHSLPFNCFFHLDPPRNCQVNLFVVLLFSLYLFFS